MRIVWSVLIVAVGGVAAGCGGGVSADQSKAGVTTPIQQGQTRGASSNTIGSAQVTKAPTSRVRAPSDSGCRRSRDSNVCHVLFIGNSYTYVNDLPMMFEDLAKAGHDPVETGLLAEADATLADHAASPETAAILGSSRWNVVVLQEQSQIPSVERFRQTEMYPAARQLVRMVRHIGAQAMFYLTPARREGWPENGLDSYTTMQTAIDEGYLVIARELHAAVAPVGYAWAVALSREANSDLWQSDGSHPGVKGTYLAACVFYATIFGKSPEGLRYHADLSSSDAAKLQAIASDVVLGEPDKWGLR